MHPLPPSFKQTKNILWVLKMILNYKFAALGEEKRDLVPLETAAAGEGKPTKGTFSPTHSEKNCLAFKNKMEGGEVHHSVIQRR